MHKHSSVDGGGGGSGVSLGYIHNIDFCYCTVMLSTSTSITSFKLKTECIISYISYVHIKDQDHWWIFIAQY